MTTTNNDPSTWSVPDTVDWMINEQTASVGLSEVQSGIFRAQAEGSAAHGWEAYWLALEGTWRQKTDNKPIPAKYRSSKSVLKNALDLGIDVRGKGKTAIEKEIKAKRDEAAKLEAVNTALRSAVAGPTPAVADASYYHAQFDALIKSAGNDLDGLDFSNFLEYIRARVI